MDKAGDNKQGLTANQIAMAIAILAVIVVLVFAAKNLEAANQSDNIGGFITALR